MGAKPSCVPFVCMVAKPRAALRPEEGRKDQRASGHAASDLEIARALQAEEDATSAYLLQRSDGFLVYHDNCARGARSREEAQVEEEQMRVALEDSAATGRGAGWRSQWRKCYICGQETGTTMKLDQSDSRFQDCPHVTCHNHFCRRKMEIEWLELKIDLQEEDELLDQKEPVEHASASSVEGQMKAQSDQDALHEQLLSKYPECWELALDAATHCDNFDAAVRYVEDSLAQEDDVYAHASNRARHANPLRFDQLVCQYQVAMVR